jgi:hypothetical protein
MLSDFVTVGLIVVVLVLGVPLLLILMFAVVTVGMWLGLPDEVVGLLTLVFGFGGGLAIEFVLLVRIYRRFRAPIDAALDGPAPAEPVLRTHDPAADPTTLRDRVREADARLAASSSPDMIEPPDATQPPD